MTETPTTLIIRERLTKALQPVHLAIRDESRAHAGHAGAARGGHFAVTVVSSAFAGLPLAARHRLVYRALAAEMTGSIHALALSTLTPEEWTSTDGDASERR